MEKRSKYFLAVLVLGAAITVGAWVFTRPPTLEQVAMRSLRAIEERDALTLIKYVHQSEIKETSLTTANLQNFLDEVVGKTFQEYSKTGSPEITHDRDAEFVVAEQLYQANDGRRASILIRIYPSNDGPVCSPLISALTFSTIAARHDSAIGPPKPGLPSVIHWRDSMSELLPALTATRIRGFKQDGVDGKFYTWQDWINRCNSIIAQKSGD